MPPTLGGAALGQHRQPGRHHGPRALHVESGSACGRRMSAMEGRGSDMNSLVALAAMCAGAAVWVLLGVVTAGQRLERLTRDPATALSRQALRGLVGRWTAIRTRRQLPRLWRTAVIELCDGLGAELSAGRAPEAAFTAAVGVLDPRVGGVLLAEWVGQRRDIDVVLARLADRPGAEGLRLLAASWRIGAERGGTFASVIHGLAVVLRDEESQRQEVAAQLAGPRTTARFLALLPLLGLAMAAALGVRPLSFFFGTLPGAVCLLLGTTLDIAGLWWTRCLVRSAEVTR
jgi:tight adherence protein B